MQTEMARDYAVAKTDMQAVRAHVQHVLVNKHTSQKKHYAEFLCATLDNDACDDVFSAILSTDIDDKKQMRLKNMLMRSFMETGFYQVMDDLEGDYVTYECLWELYCESV